MIEAIQLGKSYGDRRALDNFSLCLEAGELVGLVGPNGAGKSTLIKILSTLLPPDQGRAQICGHDVVRNPLAVRAVVGYLPDIPGLYQDMRVREFLEFFADAFHLKGPRRGQAIERALSRAGLAGREQDFVEQLSFGMKQRLVLAKTLLHDPKVLLLDEPATGLDPLARVELRELLKALNREGLTMLVSSHILSDLEDICSRVALISGGKNAAGADGQSVIDIAGAEAVEAASQRICEIEISGDLRAAAQTAAAIPGARVISQDGARLRVEVKGGAPQAAALLGRLIAGGATVVFFDSRGPGLEERYRQAFGRGAPGNKP